MKITVSGKIGSGKSTVSKKLAEKLGYDYYSVGYLMRALAEKKGISLMELSKKAEKDPDIDKDLDDMQKTIGKDKDDFVMDSRLGFHFIPDSFKIFLDVRDKEAARRIFEEQREKERYGSMREALDFIKKRTGSERQRYKKYYGLDYPDKQFFDMVVDTTDKMPKQVVETIIKTIGSKHKLRD